MTPCQLFEWAAENIPTSFFKYCSLDDYKREEILLDRRFQQSRTIPGTQKIYSIISLTRSKVSTKVYSSLTTSKEERVTVLENDLEVEDIKGFVTCVYDDQWWMACVLQVDEDNVKVSFLHRQGPSRFYKYPARRDILTIPIRYVMLTKVDPRTATGHTYTLTKRTKQLQKRSS